MITDEQQACPHEWERQQVLSDIDSPHAIVALEERCALCGLFARMERDNPDAPWRPVETW